MIKPKPMYSYIKSDEEYNALFDEKVKEDTDWWEEEYNHNAINPTDEDLKKMKEIAESGQKRRWLLSGLNKYYSELLFIGKSKYISWLTVHKHIRNEAERILWERPMVITEEYIKDLHQITLLGFGVIASLGVKDYHESRRAETIKKWKEEAKAKDKRLMKSIPFENVRCKNCRLVMQYQWSMLSNKPDEPRGKELVLFFYTCPNQCRKYAIFEDGMPWISEINNNCAICSGNRSSTITKDNAGGIYIIYECKKCGSKEVEKQER